MRFNIIGAGRLGKNLALCLMHHGRGKLIAIANNNLASAQTAVTQLGTGRAVGELIDLPAVDLNLITTPDDSIASIATALARSSHLLPGSIVAHCSGVLNSDVLNPLQDKGCLIASIHPLRAFPANYLDVDALQRCDCAIEGESHAVEVLTTLFTQMGSNIIPISSLKKNTYHAAAVMASNYVITLAKCSATLLIEAGLSHIQAKDVVVNLMQNSLNNMRDATQIADVLTGPLARGDANTIRKHLSAIHAPDINALYRSAGLATLPLTQLNNEALLAMTKQLNTHD